MASIEEEIQSRFQNDRHKASVNLIYTANWATSELDSFLKKHALTSQQYNMLRILRGAYPEPVSLKYIRVRMLDKMSDVSRMVEKLATRGYIDRWRSDDDRRIVNILINEQGLALLKAADHDVKRMEARFGALTPEELVLFNTLLDKLRTESKKFD
ncbi:MarR family winged helix-turn-helix transcriptional regulator [Rhodoflexus caldus]|uniref:MarR family winged helix-turn-helix transcriptional regulator n=1 Tax=Rhodoflexus caldus TaxID=2891236 RepID=UPI002029B73D|nr:MarR family transcriptional regulator [Rhodoflexus caldus]